MSSILLKMSFSLQPINSSSKKEILEQTDFLRAQSRSGNQQATVALFISTSAMILSLVAAYFAYEDFNGDKEWQKNQISLLERIANGNEEYCKDDTEFKKI